MPYQHDSFTGLNKKKYDNQQNCDKLTFCRPECYIVLRFKADTHYESLVETPLKVFFSNSQSYCADMSILQVYYKKEYYTVKPVLSGHSKIDKTKV